MPSNTLYVHHKKESKSFIFFFLDNSIVGRWRFELKMSLLKTLGTFRLLIKLQGYILGKRVRVLKSINIVYLKIKHLPHWPWSLMGVTAPFFLQSILEGKAVTFSYLKDVVSVEHSCPLYLFLKALNSSFVCVKY